MRIVVDGSPLCGKLTGIGYITKNMIESVAMLRPDFEIIVLSPYPIVELKGENIVNNPFSSFVRSKHVFGWRIFWFDFVLPLIVRRLEPDCFWALDGTVPFFLGKKAPVALWVYDFVFHFFPETMNFFPRFYRRQNFRFWGAKSKWRFCLTESVATEMHDVFGLKEDAITYPGVGKEFFNRRTYTRNSPEQYFLVLGTLEPRKNLSQLTRVVSSLCASGSWPQGYKVKFIGAKGWKRGQFEESLQDLEKKGVVEVLDYLPRDVVIELLSGAKALLMPSVYEGFGMPVAESIAAGCPVICSEIKPFREIDRQNECIFHSLDFFDMKELYCRVLNGDIQIPLAVDNSGLMEFDWEVSARKFLAAVNKTPD